MKKYFSWHHIVSLGETNLVGNVYFANHLVWQGTCREMFLKEHVPDILTELRSGLALVTVRCSCDYLQEFEAFDELELRMYLSETSHNQVSMDFQYMRLAPTGASLAASGSQTIASMRRENGAMVPVPLPNSIKEGLRAFSA